MATRFTLAATALILLALAAHARFAVVDSRLPQDANHAHQALPAMHHLLGTPAGALEALGAAVLEAGGWYNLLLAAGMRLSGERTGVLQAAHLIWVVALLVLLWRVARRLWGDAAGVAVLLLVPPHAMAVHQLGRLGWIHVPELALLLLAADALTADPGLERKRTVIMAGVAGLLAAALRPTGLIWVISLAPLLWPALRTPTARTRALGTAGCWAVALIPLARDIGPYLADKVEARAAYSGLSSVGTLLPQLAGDLGWPWLIMILAGGLVMALRRPPTPRPVLAMLGAWIVLPLALGVGFNVGLVNFPALHVALALVGAAGLANLPRPVLAIPAVFWLAVFCAQWIPARQAAAVYGRIPHTPPTLYRDGPNNYLRPWDGLRAAEVKALLASSCPPGEGRCSVLLESGLLHPAAMDTGQFGLFLIGGQGRVRLLETRDLGLERPPAQVHAHARFDCPAGAASYHQRQPEVARRAAALRAAMDLRPAWTRELSPGCSYIWYTPGGKLARPLSEGN